MEDMSLSEFLSHDAVKAWEQAKDVWKVRVKLGDGTLTHLTVSDCSSKFEAKERAYLYLKDKIDEYLYRKDVSQ